MMKELGVGMVGYGFMGKVQTLAYRSLPIYYDSFPVKINLIGVCTAHTASGQKAVTQAGYQFATTNYFDLLERQDIHIINCCTPNYLHKDIVVNALRAGKHVYCDKPLALNLAQAREILAAYRESGKIGQMAVQYRYIPALLRAKELIAERFLGRVFTVRSQYLHSGYIDPQRPLSWRLEKEKAGGGALFDLGSHVIDLIYYLLGDFAAIYTTTETFIRERPLPGKNGRGKVEVDDLALMQFRLKNGALGTMEVSRVATGANDDLTLEIHGDQGAIRFQLMEPNWLEIYDVRKPEGNYGGYRGFQRIESVQRYPAPAVIPGPKFSIGWIRFHIASLYDFITHLLEGTTPQADLEAGYRVQEILEAALISSRTGQWVSLPMLS